jgi:hypothetical protein
MTAEEFNATLAATSWSAAPLARRLCLGRDRSVRRWASGKIAIPPGIAAWLERWHASQARAVAIRAAHPDPTPPDDWHRAA